MDSTVLNERIKDEDNTVYDAHEDGDVIVTHDED